MGPYRINITLLFFLTALLSCKKNDRPPIITKIAEHVYHISYYDHKSGEKITDLEAELISSHNISNRIIRTDLTGNFNFTPYWDYNFYSYLKLSTQAYVEALYAVNELLDTTRPSTHTKEGSNGPNVVYARLLRKDGVDFYFTADLYRKAPVDLHILQVSDYADTLNAIFNVNIDGTDPLNPTNIFGINDLFREGIKLNPNNKIDTTIRIYAFGDYLNKISWNVYGLVEYGPEDFIRKNFSEGSLDEKNYPSDIRSTITITF